MPSDRIERSSHLRWIPVRRLKVSNVRQRHLNRHFVAKMAATFDPDKLGYPVVNLVTATGDGWVLDGQHRVRLLEAVGWGDQSMQCETYEDLTPEQEAAVFLARNTRINVRPVDWFLISVEAREPEAEDIQRTLMLHGLKVARTRRETSLTCVRALETIYRYRLLPRVLIVVKESYGGHESAWDGPLLEGVALAFYAYDGAVSDAEMIVALQRSSVGTLYARARILRDQHGRPLKDCLAAELVDRVNRGRKPRERLSPYWQASRRPVPPPEQESAAS